MERYPLVKRGYDPVMVDSDIETLENVIKSYKDKDNAIKNAIISAQIAADNMVKNAKMQADEYKEQIVHELENVRREVARERTKVQEFQNVYMELVQKHLTRINEGEVSGIYLRLDEIDRLIDNLIKTDTALNRKFDSAPLDNTEHNQEMNSLT